MLWLPESTLKRHGYYCRSRKAGNTTRLRSCISCARDKARCDNKRPRCWRCTTKTVECQYPVNTAKAAKSKAQLNDDVLAQMQITRNSFVLDAPSIDGSREVSNDGGVILNPMAELLDEDIVYPGEEYLDWNGLGIDIADLATEQTHNEDVQYPGLGAAPLVLDPKPANDHVSLMQKSRLSPRLSIPATPTHSIRSLIHRPRTMGGAQRTATLILHTLKSYPLMMPRHNTLPPFIHPSLVSSDVENQDMEPLNNCMNLVHMISSGIQGGRKLFWRNVRTECEYFCTEVA